MLWRLKAGDLGRDFVKHPLDQLAIAVIDRTDMAHVQPQPAARDRLDHLTAAEIADVALAPDAAEAAGAGLHQTVVLARIFFDQPGKLIHRESRRAMHLMLEPDRLMAPQFGM